MTDTKPETPTKSKYKNVRGPAIAMVLIAAGAQATNTARFEGEKHKAYVDMLANSRVITICNGHTGGVLITDTADHAKCQSLLIQDLIKAGDAIAPYITKPISQLTMQSFEDFSLNLGATTYINSSVNRDYNNASYTKACHDILKYKYSGGKDCFIDSNRCTGIKARREAQEQLCLKGLE